MVAVMLESSSNLNSSSFDVCTKQSFSMLNFAEHSDEAEAKAPECQQINLYSLSEKRVDNEVVEEVRQLKITLLSLSGITIENCDDSQAIDSDIIANNISITASVSFSGSCDPTDMHVMSSRLCSSSRLLCVESNPVVVPDGMNDNLIAVWDDSRPINLGDKGNSSSDHTFRYAKSRGTIPANPRSNPHLYVTLRDQSQQPSPKSNMVAGSTIMSTLSGDSKSISTSLEQNTLTKNDKISDEEMVSECDISSRSPSSGPLLHLGRSGDFMLDDGVSSSQDLAFTILNTPSTDNFRKSSIPEILEMKITLRVDHLGSLFCDDNEPEEINLIRSKCVSTPEGGGAVAHLVLFSDILDNCRSGEKGCRIIQIPVRKVCRQISRNAAHDPKLKLSADQNVAWKRFLQEPLMNVDLGESSMLRVKVESVDGHSDRCLPSITSCHATQLENVEVECNQIHSHIQDTNILNNDAATISSQIVHRNPNDTHDLDTNIAEHAVDTRANCKPSLGIDFLLKGLSGIMMNCGEDVRAFQLDDASMDSTIGSHYTL